MDADFQELVKRIVKQQGPKTLSNYNKLKAVLDEQGRGAYQQEIRLLLLTLQAGYPAKLAQAQDSAKVRQEILHELQEDYFILPQDAEGLVSLLESLLKKPNSPSSPDSPEASPKPAPDNLFILIEGGTFLMGSTRKEAYKRSNEMPQHQVNLDDFYMAKYPVTQYEFQSVLGTNPSHFKGKDLPVEHINWYTGILYCNRRSLKEGLTPAYPDEQEPASFDPAANGYRLPTEAEWEYAAKGGNKGNKVFLYAGSNDPAEVGWFKANSGDMTRTVGTKEPNSLGLFDLSGNVWEWCWDWYGEYSAQAQTNPRGPGTGEARVVRGGSWGSLDRTLRSTERGRGEPAAISSSLGLRLVRQRL
ncbi:MAG: formylglycine-generating enzyme family protein [Spirochaetaceae bacterium]|jgi:formylglycine-generating enzyme required for sulfatase activity|nr:formylglycine-generating enzyme family protein [Spirochaetaceae bacterium]